MFKYHITNVNIMSEKYGVTCQFDIFIKGLMILQHNKHAVVPITLYLQYYVSNLQN
jgi:hypothetical protein